MRKTSSLVLSAVVATTASAATRDATVESFSPAQGGVVFYSTGSIPSGFQHKDLLTILPRDPSRDVTGLQAAADAGAVLAAYLDPVMEDCAQWDTNTPACDQVAPVGPYQQMLFLPTDGCGEAGAAIPPWKNGVVEDHKNGVGSDVTVPWFAQKLVCVVKKIKADHPYVKAIFLDDYGPEWTGYKNADAGRTDAAYECAARQALGDAFQQLRAANLDLIYFVNSSWFKSNNPPGTPCSSYPTGGYPTAALNGLAGALPVLEHPTSGTLNGADGYYGPTTSQWLKDLRTGYTGVFAITRGILINSTQTDTDIVKAKPWTGWITQQTQYNTGIPTTPLASGHSIGLTYGTRYGVFTFDGPSSTGQSADRLRATAVKVGSSGTLKNAAIYLDGLGGTSGTQSVQLALYADNNGVPGNLVAVSSEFGVDASSGPFWYSASFPATAIAAGTYWLTEFTGQTAGVTRNRGLTNVSNYRGAVAPYSAGAPLSFPASTAGTIEMDVFLTIE